MQQNKRLAIISGGTGYLGSAVALELIRNNWHVVSLARNSAGDYEVLECDITDGASVQRAVEQITQKHGPIHACIHTAAAPLTRKPALSLSEEEFRADIETSVYGAFFLYKHAVKHIPHGGVFVGITTAGIEAKPPVANMGAYIPAKSALRGLLRTLSQELLDQGIRVNAVAPDFLPGGLNSDLPKAVLDFIDKKSNPEGETLLKVVQTIRKLCIEPSAFASGTSIRLPAGDVSPL
jgi:beta-ketoacyl ACP reductase